MTGAEDWPAGQRFARVLTASAGMTKVTSLHCPDRIGSSEPADALSGVISRLRAEPRKNETANFYRQLR
jgi:hypothetical protein